MRISLIALILTGFLIGCAGSKLPPSQPSKRMMDKANTILLRVNASAEDAFDGFSKHLSDRGFSFESRDTSRNELSTNMTESRYFDFQFGMDVSVVDTDSATVIKVKGKAQNFDFGEIEPEYWGMDQSVNMQAWTQLRQIVESYPHEELFYQRN